MISTVLIGLFLVSTSYAVYDTDPDAKRTIIEIIKSRNLKPEIHHVTTADGYILTLHRIVNESSTVKDKRPIIVQHGLESSSTDFLVNAPDLGTEFSTATFDGKVVSNNLGFALVMHEYDVWLPNSRGNRFSREHVIMDSTDNSKYWQFSFDEMIKYDLPAVIKYIQKVTKRKTVGYIGHSQGTEIMFGLLADKPQYSEIVKPVVMLAPVARIKNAKTFFRIANYIPGLKPYLKNIPGPFFETDNSTQQMLSKLCQIEMVESLVCSSAMFLICGFNSRQLNGTRVQVYIAHATAGTSNQNMYHYTQSYEHGGFRKFDYGTSMNLKKYGTPFAPEYNLKNINSTDIALLYGANDWLADLKDVNFIRKQIGKDKLKMDYEVPVLSWNHLDFLFGLKAAEYVYVKVIELLSQYRNLP